MDYIQIGKIVATFGIKGEIILTHVLGQRSSLKGVKAIFVEETKNNKIPWFVQSAQAKAMDETIVQLEDLHSKESAHRLIHKKVWLTQADFAKLAAPQSPIALLGYLLYDGNQPLGKVEEVIQQPHQVLLRIEYKGKEALIPLHGETLQSVNHSQKEIFLQLPDGLLEIYE